MMTKKNTNTLLYSVLLAIFILLFLVTKSPKHIEKQLPAASAETSIDDVDIAKKLNLQAYNALQTEFADLQRNVNDSTQLLYFKKRGKTVQIYLLKNDASEVSQLQLTLNETNSYDFNSTFDNLKIFTTTNLGNMLLNANSKWTENNYTSSKFPALLGWSAEFAEKFNTLRREKITQNNAQVPANTTKAIHFFLWSTLEYLKAGQLNNLYYTISKNSEKYTATSSFYKFDHKRSRAEHKNDSLQQISQFKENLKNTAVQETTNTVSENDNELTSQILLIVGMLTSLFLIVREQIPKNKIPVSHKEKTPKRTAEEIMQRSIRKINSLQEASKLPWKAAVEKELTFLIEHKEITKKILTAKDKKDETFLNSLKEVFPSQIAQLIVQKEKLQSIEKINSDFKNGIQNANTISELLLHLHTWSTTFQVENLKWKVLAETISDKQKTIQKEENNTKKLAQIQECYHNITNTKEDVLNKVLTQFAEKTQQLQHANELQLEKVQKEAESSIKTIKAQAEKAYTTLKTAKKISDNNNKLVETYFANMYDLHIKEFQNKARNFDHLELTKRLAFIAFNVMDLAKFINDNWSADAQTEGNIRSILRGEALSEIPKENYNPNSATSYLNTMVAFLHKNGVNEVEHLIDGIDINEELKSLH
ncbi:hypothetical protein KORDIASMS9_03020 [Kordia sp. SMS9]|uniref:hypothetical protein n=1 Tax=Kordia sp. SMS9 TaxID=2282170 RepID=UPI000E10A68D|nr:hypothetical protein [Kordia sp. SMS9]AXG70774.1 hypothetical protein KORDIASMS9_03020 [Kordia sp. SMS9]